MATSLVSEVHPELFHYTNERGLAGILRSQSLWATHWCHLNDIGELMHFREVLPDAIRPELVAWLKEGAPKEATIDGRLPVRIDFNGDFTRAADYFSAVLYENLFKPNPSENLFEFYITSFCTPEGAHPAVRAEGLLSQWRYYGQDGGYVLVFDTAQLEELMQTEESAWPCRLRTL